MFYGSPRDRNMCRLIRFVRRWPVVPVAGDGERMQQPVFVDDVASAMLAALRSDTPIGRAYDLPGARPLTFNEVIDTVARLLGRRVRKIHLPVALLLRPLQLAERLGMRLPVKSEQILRLNEDKAFDYAEAARDFGYAPCLFEEGIRREVAEMW
jgi:nucleoside-diphosphate-sugar epimerase